MLHPAKWRDGTDPFALSFTCFQLEEVLGYPHAGNDVFHVKGVHKERPVEAYIKVARHQEANLQREVQLLRQLSMPHLPRLLDWDAEYRWLVTEARPGQRLSVIAGDNADGASLRYMENFGECLARWHGHQHSFEDAPHRRFMEVPDAGYCERHRLQAVRAWLEANKPDKSEPCFVHGDFHYANILWENGDISGILDLEMAGMGDREFDIAWALIRRPGQRFMNTQEEVGLFLRGYRKLGTYDEVRLHWYMVCAYAWFLGIGADDTEYAAWVRRWLEQSK